ncbi:MAG: group II intron reverse transcriptase/maturase [Peptococcaceae bacterium]|nr:group II intron reverse transcriptase/maturase [Peptococcaceae bacterium]
MNGAHATCASPYQSKAWDQINWDQCRKMIRKLQARIVKAIQGGRWGKVKALQHLLTHSWSAKALAVKRVTENRGKNTPGVDKTIWPTKETRFKAISALKQRGYQPKPLRRVYIPKAGNSYKMRPLSVPTMFDRAMQTLYKLALEPIAETTGDPNSYGFRPHRSTHDAICQCHTCLSRDKSAKWILEGDIKSAFDNVSHDWIMENIPIDKVILRKFIKCGYIDTGKLFPTEQGTGQGSVISPVIFNMVLDGMEPEIKRLAKKIKVRDHKHPKINVIRYADDFVVTGDNREILEQEIKPLVEEFLSKRGLHLSEEKTIITHIDEGFDFLGWNVRKYKGKLLIKPAKKKTIAFTNEIRDAIKSKKTAKQESLIRILNPKIIGWAHHHRRVCAKKTYSWVDHQIWNCLWKWAKRRHPDKGKKWIAGKYFHRIGDNNWVFSVRNNPEGQYQTLHLAASTKIRRHVMVKSALNPFDKNWWGYLENRKKRKYRTEVGAADLIV